ncbi:MAG TPA: DNA-processing protein DprA [Actinomycetota bacterium]|jgi:DNA processing protein|nr:DNA-processing protein DprA [Actinomycetota bacterium]
MPAEVSDPSTGAASDPWPAWPDGFAEADQDRRALLVLVSLRGITPRRLLELAVRSGTASAALAAIGRGEAGSEKDRAFASALDPDAIAAAVRARGARFVPWGDPGYPEQLRSIHDPPAGVFVAGPSPPDVTRAVAVVGARRCTELGREQAREVGRGLGSAGVTVVSGAARGIDAAAHEGALSVGAATLAVLGCGLDVDYPPGNRHLLRRIRASGGVVSEYAPGVPPDPWNFPARNRIVAGLCSATVVIEGADGSGSLITAEHAMEFGRDVFAVPGPVNSPLAAVPLRLIRDGATMIRGAADLLDDLGLEPVGEPLGGSADLSAADREVLDRLAGPTLPDRIAAEMGSTVPEVVQVLMRLELRGFVRSVGGRYESTLKARSAQAPPRSSRSARGTPAVDTTRTGTPSRANMLATMEER